MIEEVMREVTNIISPVYLVGGAVRDYIMDKEVDDYDFTTPHPPEVVEQTVRENNPGRWVGTTGKQYGTIGTKLYLPTNDCYVKIEITTFREEKYISTNGKPEVKFVSSLHEDLSRRDFTINAIALRNKKGINNYIDPFNGMDDIENGIIRAVGSARTRFKEDPTRMLRAARFVSTLGFAIEPLTMKRMTSGSIDILNKPKEAWVIQLDKLLMGDNVVAGLNILAESRLLNYMIPELAMQVGYDQMTPHHDFTLWEHTCKVVEASPKEVDFRWAALLHDVAKPFVAKVKDNNPLQKNYMGHEVLGKEISERICRYLKMPTARIKSISSMVANHLEDDSPLKPYDSGTQKRLEE